MSRTPQHIQLKVMGTLQILDAQGAPLAIKGVKNQALLALLALSPKMARPRRWIEDKLWSTFGPEQASANLRQALSKLRLALGEAADLLQADRGGISLDPDRVNVDLLDGYLPEDDRVELLEGLDVRDPEFEEWIRQERANVVSRIARVRPAAATGVLIDVSTLAENFSREQMIGDVLVNQIAENVGEQIRVWRQSRSADDPGRNTPESDVAVTVQVMPDGSRYALFIKALHKPSARILYSKMLQIDRLEDVLDAGKDIGKVIFEAADKIIGKLPQVLDTDRPETRATALSRLGLYRMFSFERNALREAYGLMMQAFELDKNGVYLAWCSLIRTIQIMEMAESDRDGLRDEAVALHYRALEHGHDNPLVHALAGKVRGTALRDQVGFFEMAKDALERNPASAFAWNAWAEANMQTGQIEEALSASRRASYIASTSPFKHWWDNGRCLIAIAANRPDEAIEAGEAAARAAPMSRPAHRQLLALYALKGEFEKAMSTAEKLAKIEPGFTLDQLVNDENYPVRTLRNKGLLEPIRALL